MRYKKEFIGEILGTFVLIMFGCGTTIVAVLFGVFQSLMQVALAWGVGVTLAVYLTRHISDAHINPAVSFAMVVGKRMDSRKLPTYLLGQFLGAFLAGLVLYMLFSPSIASYETTHGILRGAPESVTTAKMFGEFYPNPGSTAIVTLPLAMFAEALGTFLLLILVFALTEGSNVGRPDDSIAPLFVGLAVTAIICIISPLTECGLNPARDFGPRMVTWLFGWGKAAFPDHVGGFFWVYILSPIVGGSLGSFFFVHVLEPVMKHSSNGKSNE